ncbi:hypothetical protein C6A87_027275 [Mycobacterium sp. ITM-2016-00317]|uniref:hypothetical protein n=1 Tax=Mycobacterium sp. ITM-2016-00317 TaxID=2099694 RepID=UPI000D4AD5E5|nr:hypothetical protein [Mycobacterium sp. ITM-2016-00317]WNG87399.1 hypothetical protein C6A87_027275 [Mycobacterium sp. ITM-2016-00317]
MKFLPPHLRQRDGVTCGPTVAVVACAMVDPAYRLSLDAPDAGVWFAAEQGRVHASVNRVWPRAWGTTPVGMARAVTACSRGRGVRYRWRLWRGSHDGLADVLAAVRSGWPVAMLVGRFIPRHWVLIVALTGEAARCYEPSSGEVCTVALEAVRRGRMTGPGYPRPFAFVLPNCSTRSATD